MHCLSRTIRPHQRHHCRLTDFCSSVISTISLPPARPSASILPIVRLTCTQSPLISTYLHSKAYSYHHPCPRPGVSFMDSGPDFSINPLSVASDTAASRDDDVTNNEERLDESRGGLDREPESSNSFSSGAAASEEAGVGSDDSGNEESVVEYGEEWNGPTESTGKRALPDELASSVLKLTCESTAPDGDGVCDVYLVGTAHVSSESCQQVEAVISLLQPQVVFLELCSSRVNILQPQNLKVPTVGEMMDMWKKKHNLFGILYSWFLAKVASQLEVLPGAEFRVAYEEAMKYGGKVILGDRPVQITLRRTWAKMPIWHKTKLLSSLLFQAFSLPNPEELTKMLKEMDDSDMLTLVIQEMSKQFPTLMETLVHERDRYMSSTLLRVARDHTSVVAVVGKGHLPGIKKYWNQPVEIKELLTMPTTKRPTFCVRNMFTIAGVAVAGVAIVSGLYLSSKK